MTKYAYAGTVDFGCGNGAPPPPPPPPPPSQPPPFDLLNRKYYWTLAYLSLKFEKIMHLKPRHSICFAACNLVWCGDGTCVANGTGHICQCTEDSANLFNMTGFACFKKCKTFPPTVKVWALRYGVCFIF